MTPYLIIDEEDFAQKLAQNGPVHLQTNTIN